MFSKTQPAELAVFGGAPVFDSIRSISNLVQPDIKRFLAYSKTFHDAGQYTDHGVVERELERRLAQFHEVKHCISFAGGFWGLVMAMKCLALPGRTEVVMPSLTYRRLADIVAWAGLVPHFCEVDPRTLSITAENATSCINEKTALILGVHPIVNCCDVEGLESLSAQTGIPLLFDAVESVYDIVSRTQNRLMWARRMLFHAIEQAVQRLRGRLCDNQRRHARRAFAGYAPQWVTGGWHG